MSIWHKILIAFIFLTIPFNFFFTCRTLKTHQVWREKIVNFEKKLEQLDKENHDLEFGQIDDKTGLITEKGIRQYESELDVAMFRRGRAWLGAKVDINDDNIKTGNLILDITEPDPHKIQKGAILYCFSAKSAGEIDEKYKELGNAYISESYIGKFTVVQTDGTKIQVIPSMNMTMSAEGQPLHPNSYLTDKLKKSYGYWNLYEKMPCDEHTMFLTMEEDTIRELIPESSIAEYLVENNEKDSKDNPDSPKSKYNQERKLRDYERIFDSISMNLTKLDDLIIATTIDCAYVQNSLQEAKTLEASQENLKKQISEQLDTVRKERDAVVTQLKMLDGRCAVYVARIKQLREENGKLAKQIDEKQRSAAKKILERGQRVNNGLAATF